MADGQKVVVFADILGFAALTDACDLEPEYLRRSNQLDAMFGSVFRPRNRLTHTFAEFHRTMRSALDLSNLRHSSTAIAFSDSAFVATDLLYEAAGIASHLMRSTLTLGIPLRMGIAKGTFEAIRFRSDVSTIGGEHAAQFLGTGVTRAYATEGCGIKGCRILLHPTAAELLQDVTHNPPIPAASHVEWIECATSEFSNAVSIRYEINYWSFGPTAEKGAWRALQDMWNDAPIDQHHHYQATAEAIDRMRTAKHRPPIANLRRRTLPT